MIIKRPHRRVKLRIDKKTNDEFWEMTDYIIWWFLGIIPIYIIEIDKFTSINDDKPLHYNYYKWMRKG